MIKNLNESVQVIYTETATSKSGKEYTRFNVAFKNVYVFSAFCNNEQKTLFDLMPGKEEKG